MNYKSAIYTARLNRRLIAEKMNLSYGALSLRLGGFQQWKKGEKEKLEKVIEEMKQQN